MIRTLPLFLRKSVLVQEKFGAEEIEFGNREARLEDIRLQMSIDTATWGLVIYENELNIPTDLSKSYEDRRAVIKSKWRGSGKVDRTLIKSVADAFTNGACDVGFDGSIVVKFNSFHGVPDNLDDVKNAIEEIKPCHLPVKYEYTYLLIRDIHEVMTIGEMDSTVMNKFAGGGVDG